jgi:5-methylcytosine-specific restriction protein A
VTVGLETLKGEGGAAELDRAGVVPAEVARRLACDASIRRVVLSARSEPLDVGRRTPVVPPALRRAVILRDRRCRFPGCDRPPAWCDVHHIVPWSHGGPTSLANLGLLCRRHHRLVHPPNGFGTRVIEGEIVFDRPDGTRLEDRAPPVELAV